MQHAAPPKRRVWLLGVGAVVVVVMLWGVVAWRDRDDSSATAATDGGGQQTAAEVPETTTTTRPPYDGWVDPLSSGEKWDVETDGYLTFRGNPTRSWYGEGPVPSDPQVLWTYPGAGGMCGRSSDGGNVSTWCGDGWTGNPNVFERDGRTWVSFGGYDYGLHWLDADTGEEIVDTYTTGDLAKGSMTTDPDGFPLSYKGSRDSNFYVVATDRGEQPEVLWKLNAYDYGVQKIWNDDFDGAALVIDDHLFVSGENSWFYIVKLNRGYDAAGKVTVAPQLVATLPSFDDQLAVDAPDRHWSIETSPTISGNTLYFANSAGLIQGFDISRVKDGVAPTRVFRYWTGDDTDATIVADADGTLYVGSEWEKGNARSKQVGQMMKLDPSRPDDPLVWSLPDQVAGKAGIWATPALGDGVVYFATNAGRVLGVDKVTGEVLWEKNLGSQTWGSPVVVDDTLIEGDCEGNLNAYDVSDPRVDPPLEWTVELDGCIETTPAVWRGRIYLATRSGQFYALGDPDDPAATTTSSSTGSATPG
jgi:outer membrane protein assembly factor BamB